MVCLGILWNSMQDYLGEAIEDISSYGSIKGAFTMELNDQYESFVRDIYSQDDIAEWKVDKKLETMFKCSDNRNITVVIVDVDSSKQVYHPLKKRMVYENLENMKTNLRKKYSEKVDHYFFDNVFHMTDDEREYDADLGIVKQYMDRVDVVPIDLGEEKAKDKVLTLGVRNETERKN